MPVLIFSFCFPISFFPLFSPQALLIFSRAFLFLLTCILYSPCSAPHLLGTLLLKGYSKLTCSSFFTRKTNYSIISPNTVLSYEFAAFVVTDLAFGLILPCVDLLSFPLESDNVSVDFTTFIYLKISSSHNWLII